MTSGAGWDKMMSGLQRLVVRTFDREPAPPLMFGSGLASSGVEVPNGIYRDSNEQVEIAGTEVAISSDSPVLHVRLVDLPRAPITGDGGDELEFRSLRWKIKDALEDGEGMLALLLASRGAA